MKKIYTEEQKEKRRKYYLENKEKEKAYMAAYYKANKKKFAKHNSEYYKANKETIAEKRKSPMGRANNLLQAYKISDSEFNRGKCTLTAKWIVDNIFTQQCHYCGKNDWTKLGCDRIDNDLPHTPDNVVPCCSECNQKKGSIKYEEYIKMLGKTS